MLDGAIDHVGDLLEMVIVMVWPIEREGVPLSETDILNWQFWGWAAEKVTLQLAGKPEPLTVGVNKAQLVPPEKQVKVCPVSTSVATPSVRL